MAGSLTWRQYEADNGQNYSIRVDESNARAVLTPSPVFVADRTANHPQLPRGIKKRYILAYSVANPRLRRKFTIGSIATFQGMRNNPNQVFSAPAYGDPTDASAGVAIDWAITFYRGEESRLASPITAADTGLTDGTAGQ